MAYQRIVDPDSKDYIDLVILSGDLAAARTNTEEADTYYARALELCRANDREISEMRARAFLKRGKNAAAANRGQEAIADLTKAADIWSHLGEEESAAQAKWEVINLTHKFAHEILNEFEREEVLVRVSAVDYHESLIGSRSASGSPQRARLDRNYWKTRLREARERVAANATEW